MTTGILTLLTTFASMTGYYIPDDFIQNNMPRIKTVLNMVEKQLPGSCNVLGPINSKDNRLLSLGVVCQEKISRKEYRYYNGRLLIDIKTLSFIRLKDKK